MKKKTLLDTLQSQKHAEENQNKPLYGNYKIDERIFENEKGEKFNYEEAQKQLRIYHKVENTPFTIVEENNQFTMIMGNYRMHKEPYNTYQECKEDMLERKMWHTIGAYLFALHDFTKKLEEENEKIINKDLIEKPLS